MKLQIRLSIKTPYAAASRIWTEDQQTREFITISSVPSFYLQPSYAYLYGYGCWYGYAGL